MALSTVWDILNVKIQSSVAYQMELVASARELWLQCFYWFLSFLPAICCWKQLAVPAASGSKPRLNTKAVKRPTKKKKNPAGINLWKAGVIVCVFMMHCSVLSMLASGRKRVTCKCTISRVWYITSTHTGIAASRPNSPAWSGNKQKQIK